MKKLVKKVITLAAAMSMAAAMGISAMAADTYSMLGNACLFGDSEMKDTWEPTNEDLFLTEVSGQDGIYVCERTFVKGPADATEEEIGQWTQFKIVADADMMGWSYQMCLGNPEAAWADNQTQFKIDQSKLKEGKFRVYVKPADGLLAIVQDGQSVDYFVRFHSRDEDSWNFVEPTVAAVKADGYDDGAINFTDKALADFKALCVSIDGTSAPAAQSAPAEEETTTAAPTAQTSTVNAPKTGDMAPVAVVALLLASAAIVTVAKKKEA